MTQIRIRNALPLPTVSARAVAVLRRPAAICAVFVAFAPGIAAAFPIGFGHRCSFSGSAGASDVYAPSPGANTGSFLGECGGSGASKQGTVHVPVVTDAGPALFSFNQSAQTSVVVRSALGSLGASSTSIAISDPEAYLYTSNNFGAIIENLYEAGAASGATASWWDLLTVGGTPNVNGFLRFTLDLHGTTFATPPVVGSASMDSFPQRREYPDLHGAHVARLLRSGNEMVLGTVADAQLKCFQKSTARLSA